MSRVYGDLTRMIYLIVLSINLKKIQQYENRNNTLTYKKL